MFFNKKNSNVPQEPFKKEKLSKLALDHFVSKYMPDKKFPETKEYKLANGQVIKYAYRKARIEGHEHLEYLLGQTKPFHIRDNDFNRLRNGEINGSDVQLNFDIADLLYVANGDGTFSPWTTSSEELMSLIDVSQTVGCILPEYNDQLGCYTFTASPNVDAQIYDSRNERMH